MRRFKEGFRRATAVALSAVFMLQSGQMQVLAATPTSGMVAETDLPEVETATGTASTGTTAASATGTASNGTTAASATGTASNGTTAEASAEAATRVATGSTTTGTAAAASTGSTGSTSKDTAAAATSVTTAATKSSLSSDRLDAVSDGGTTYYMSTESVQSSYFTFTSDEITSSLYGGSIQMITADGKTVLAHTLPTENVSWYKNSSSSKYTVSKSLYVEKRISPGTYSLQYVKDYDKYSINEKITVTESPIVSSLSGSSGYTEENEANLYVTIVNPRGIKPEDLEVYFTDESGNILTEGSYAYSVDSSNPSEVDFYYVCKTKEPLAKGDKLYPKVKINGEDPIIICNVDGSTVYDRGETRPEITDVFLSDAASGEITVVTENAIPSTEYAFVVSDYYGDSFGREIFYKGTLTADSTGVFKMNLTRNGFPVSADVTDDDLCIYMGSADEEDIINHSYSYKELDCDSSYGFLHRDTSAVLKQKSGNLYTARLTMTNWGQEYYASYNNTAFSVLVHDSSYKELARVSMKSGTASREKNRTQYGMEYQISFDVELKASYQNEDYQYNICPSENESYYATLESSVEEPSLGGCYPESRDYDTRTFWGNFGIVPIYLSVYNYGTYDSAYLVIKNSSGGQVYKSSKLPKGDISDEYMYLETTVSPDIFTDGESYTFGVIYNGKTLYYDTAYTFTSEIYANNDNLNLTLNSLKEGDRTACFSVGGSYIRNFTKEMLLSDSGYYDLSLTNRSSNVTWSYDSVDISYDNSYFYLYPKYSKAIDLGSYNYLRSVSKGSDGKYTEEKDYNTIDAYADCDTDADLYLVDSELAVYINPVTEGAAYTIDVYRDNARVAEDITLTQYKDQYYRPARDISAMGDRVVVYMDERPVDDSSYPDYSEDVNRTEYIVISYERDQRYQYVDSYEKRFLYRTTVQDVGFHFVAQNYCKVRMSESKSGLSGVSYTTLGGGYSNDIYKITLSDGAGEKTIYLQFEDAYGNESDIKEYKVYYDPAGNVPKIVDYSVTPDPDGIISGEDMTFRIRTDSPFCVAIAAFTSPDTLPEDSTKELYFDENGYTVFLDYKGTDDYGYHIFERTVNVSETSYYFTNFEFDKVKLWLASFEAYRYYASSRTEITEKIQMPFSFIKEVTAVTIPKLPSHYSTYYLNKLPVTYTGYGTADATATITLTPADFTGDSVVINAPISSKCKFEFTLQDLQDGKYTLTATDGTLDLEDGSRTIVIDRVAPVIDKFSAVRTDGETDANVTLSWTVDSKDVSYYLLWKNNAPVWTESDKKSATTVILPNYVDGDEYKLIAVDRAGNRSEPKIKVLGDEIPPSDVPNFKLVDRASKSVSLKWDAATDNVKVNGYVIYRDGKEITTVGADKLTYMDTGLENGKEYVYGIKAVDKALNYSVNEVTLTASTDSPVIVSYFTPEEEYIIEQEKEVEFNLVTKWIENLAPVNFEFKYRVKGTEDWKSLCKRELENGNTDKHVVKIAEWDPANYEFKYTLTDRDETEVSQIVETVIAHDHVDPVAYISAPAEDKLLNKVVTITGGADDESKMGSISVYAGATESTYELIATIKDINESSSEGEQTGDTDPLEVKDGNKTSKLSTTFTVDWDTTQILTNYGYIKVIARDSYGNTNVVTRRIRLDNIPPAAPTDFEIFADDTKISVYWGKDPVEEDFDTFKVYRSESADGEFSVVSTQKTIGYFDDVTTGIVKNTDYYYYVTALDKLGNESEGTFISKGRMEEDRTAPIVNSYLPGKGKKLYKKETLSIAAYDNYKLASLKAYYREASAAEWTELTSFETEKKRDVFTYDWDLTGLASGNYQVKYLAQDTKGNISKEVIVDYKVEEYTLPVPPVVTYEAGFKTIKLNWTYSGNEDLVNKYTVYRDGEVIRNTARKNYDDTPVVISNEYTYYVKVEDKFGATEVSEAITAKTDVPDEEDPKAVFSPVNLNETPGTAINFDATGSSDNDVIASYEWDFGDGETGTGKTVEHTYTELGKYTVTLKVTDDYGNSSETSTTVTIVELGVEDENGDVYQDVSISFVSSRTGEVLPNTEVTITKALKDGEEGEPEEICAVTGSSGVIKAILSTGNYKINAICDGYRVAVSRIAVLNREHQTYTVTLRDMDILVGKLTSREMTLDEMIAAGIDINDPDNQHVFKFAVVLQFSPEKGSTFSIPINIYRNQGGTVLLASSGSGFVEPTAGGGGVCFYIGSQRVTIYPASEELFLVIYGEAHWLKEMFDVELLLTNQSAVEHFEDVEATLELPEEGLSLASMIRGQQNVKEKIGTIAENGSATVHWYVRGDKEGEYDLSAETTGRYMPNDEEFVKTFKTDQPLKVWAGSALQLTITASDIAKKGQPYDVEFELENVSTKELYNLSFQITGSEQFVVKDGEKKELEKDDKGCAVKSVRVFKPGDTLKYEYTTVISDSAILTHTEYYLKNCFAVTLEGSTTEIPIIFNIAREGKPQIDLQKKTDVTFCVKKESDQTPVEGVYVFSDYIRAGHAQKTDSKGYVVFEDIAYTETPQTVGVSYEDNSMPIRLEDYNVSSDLPLYTIYIPDGSDPFVSKLVFKNPDGNERQYTYFTTAKYAVEKDSEERHTITMDVNWQEHQPGTVYLVGKTSGKSVIVPQISGEELTKYRKTQKNLKMCRYELQSAFGKTFDNGETINLVLSTGENKEFVQVFPMRVVEHFKETMIREIMRNMSMPDFMQTPPTQLEFSGGELLANKPYSFGINLEFFDDWELGPKLDYGDGEIVLDLGAEGKKESKQYYSADVSMIGKDAIKSVPELKITVAYDEFGYSSTAVDLNFTTSSVTSFKPIDKYDFSKKVTSKKDSSIKATLAENTFYVPEVPGLYIRTGASLGIMFGVGIRRMKGDDWKYNVHHSTEGGVEAAFGYGIPDALTVEPIIGELSAKYEVQIPEPVLKASVKGELKGQVVVLFQNIEWSYAEKSYDWSSESLAKKTEEPMKPALKITEDGVDWYKSSNVGYSPLSAGGSKGDALISGDAPLFPVGAEAEDLPDAVTLIKGVYKGTATRINAADKDTTLLLINRQQPGRTPANKMGLMYSKATPTAWEEPVLVDPEDSTMTGQFDSAETGSDLWVTYQNMNKVFDEGYGEDELDIADYYSHFDIAVNRYDPKTDTWSGKEMLSSDSDYDFMPSIHADGDKAIVAWGSADADTYFGGNHSTTLNYRIFNGSEWSGLRKIPLTNMVTAIDTLCDGSDYRITYSYLDSNNKSVQKEIDLSENGEIKAQAKDSEDADNVIAGSYFEVGGILKKVYMADDMIVVEDAEALDAGGLADLGAAGAGVAGSGEIEAAGVAGSGELDAAGAVGDKYEISAGIGASGVGTAVNGDNAVIYWTETVSTDEGSANQVFISRYDSVQNKWTEGVPVFTEEGQISGVSMLLLDDQNVAATYLKSDGDVADLCYKVTNFMKPHMGVDVNGVDFTRMTNGSVKMEIPYANLGTAASNGLNIFVYSNDADGMLLGKASVRETIEPGDEKSEIISLIPQEDTKAFYVVLKDSQGNETGVMVDYNSVELGIETAYVSSTPGSYDLEMDIANNGATDAADVVVEVHREGNNGDVVAEKVLPDISTLEKQRLHIEIPKDIITFDEDIVPYYIKAYEKEDPENFVSDTVFMYRPEGVEITETYTGSALELSNYINSQRSFMNGMGTGGNTGSGAGKGYHISKNGKDVLTTEKWTKQNFADEYADAIDKAEAFLKVNGVSDDMLESALVDLKKARYRFDTTFKAGKLIPATDIQVNPVMVSIKPGKSKKVSVKLKNYGEPGVDGTLAQLMGLTALKHTDAVESYEISDSSVATVTNKGMVKALKEGDAVITITLMSGLTAKCPVHIRNDIMAVSVNSLSANMVVGKKLKLKGTVYPEGTGAKISWSSDDESIATVDKNGNVKALSPGTVRIHAKPMTKDKRVLDGFDSYCEITVYKGLQNIILNSSAMTLWTDSPIYGNTGQIELADNEYDDVLTYKSSKTKVATVSSNGLVTAVSPGKAVITVKGLGGKKATCKVTVAPCATSLELTPPKNVASSSSGGTISVNLLEGERLKMRAVTEPRKNKDRIVWVSSDPNIASVDSKGYVRGRGIGTAKITATCESSGISRSFNVTVSSGAVKVSIYANTNKVLSGKKLILRAKFAPARARDKVSWFTNDPYTATVSDNGEVTGVSSGSVVILATTSSGLVGKYRVYVVNGAEKVELDAVEMSLSINGAPGTDKKRLRAVCSGEDMVSFTTSNKKVATVTSGGLVVARGEGKAVITAVTASGKKASCKVTVTEYATAVAVDKSSVTVPENKSVTLKATAYSGSIASNTASDRKVVWKYADESDAMYIEIGKNGKIKALKAKKDAIRLLAYAADGSGVYSSVSVTVR